MKRSLGICFFIFLSLNAYAFKFSPMTTSIYVDEKQRSAQFYLENDSDQPIAVTATLLKRDINIDGNEINQTPSNDISVYPTQLIIAAREKRSVKVSWTGKNISQEESYRLVAEQLPIELQKEKTKKTSIKVLLRYVAALYVTSDQFKSEVSVKDVAVKGKDVVFTLENSGKKHQILSNLNLKITGDKSVELSSEELKGMSGENILAESIRSFVFTRDGKFKDIKKTDKVKLQFDKD